MKKRFLCLLLVACLLLPISAFAAGQDNGSACFDFLKDYLKANEILNNGAYTYQGIEKIVDGNGREISVSVIVKYYYATDMLTFGIETNQSDVAYRSEVQVPASLNMPYDAAQHLSALGRTYDNEGKISSDFTTASKVELSGETFGTEQLFPYTIALALRHAQSNLLAASGYTIADLGFTALYEELFSNKPCDGGDNCPSRDFTDVDHGPKSWYHAAVDWAVTANVTNGKSATSFAPNDSCTRAQMVTFLWRAMGEPEPTLQTSKFVDVPADQYYTKAVLWAVENGVTDGVDATHFGPNQTVTRAQTVTFLWRMMEKPAPQGGVSFPDVPSGEYYSEAVAWAVENEITNGMNGVFAPKNDCTRAQIVTFLYRTIVK